MLILLCIVIATSSPSDDTAGVRVGLTLSAGSAFGLAHIGVLKVLEREQIPVSCISSNSMGSIVGGLHASGYSAAQIESIAVSQDWDDLLSPSFKHTTRYIPKSQQIRRYVFRWSHDWFIPSMPREIISLQKVEFLLMKLLSKIEYDTEYSFDRLRIPLRVIAVDIVSGKRIVMKRGRLDRAIRGSIALPAVFAPQTALDEGILVDGGVLQYFPVDPLLEFEPDMIIASLTIKPDTSTGTSIVDVLSRVTSIVGSEDIERQKALADVVIEPEVSEFESGDYGRAPEIIAAGERAAQAAIPAIRTALAGRGPAAHPNPIVEKDIPYVRAISFNGLQQTRAATIRREIHTHPGMPLDFDVLIDDLTKLYETGLFNHVDYELSPVGEDSIDVAINLDEQSYGFYLLGIRYDNADNATIGIEVGQSNILGLGLCVRAAVHLGDPNEYRIGLADTRTFALPMGYQIALFWSSIDRAFYLDHEWQDDYNVDRRGGIAELGYAWAERSFVNAGIETYQAVYRLPRSPFADTMPQSEWVSGPRFGFEIGDYDDPYFPLRGGRFRFEAFHSLKLLGGRNDALKLDIYADRLFPITPWLTLRIGLESGISSGELAWAEYFHTGGYDLIGFAHEEFTTLHRTILHMGMDFPVVPIVIQGSPVVLQLLANVALFEPLDEFSEWIGRPIEDFEVGIGAGVRANTPIGPFHFIFGIGNPHRMPATENLQFKVYLSLGREFRYTR